MAFIQEEHDDWLTQLLPLARVQPSTVPVQPAFPKFAVAVAPHAQPDTALQNIDAAEMTIGEPELATFWDKLTVNVPAPPVPELTEVMTVLAEMPVPVSVMPTAKRPTMGLAVEPETTVRVVPAMKPDMKGVVERVNVGVPVHEATDCDRRYVPASSCVPTPAVTLVVVKIASIKVPSGMAQVPAVAAMYMPT